MNTGYKWHVNQRALINHTERQRFPRVQVSHYPPCPSRFAQRSKVFPKKRPEAREFNYAAGWRASRDRQLHQSRDDNESFFFLLPPSPPLAARLVSFLTSSLFHIIPIIYAGAETRSLVLASALISGSFLEPGKKLFVRSHDVLSSPPGQRARITRSSFLPPHSYPRFSPHPGEQVSSRGREKSSTVTRGKKKQTPDAPWRISTLPSCGFGSLISWYVRVNCG